MSEVFVYVDLNGETHFVGRLWTRSRNRRESASFEYDRSWLEHSDRFALEPLLSLTEGQFHTGQGKALFGSLGDSAPDRWGRILMRRLARRLAQDSGTGLRTLSEMEFLLGVNDEARQGALRFSKEQGGAFLAVDGTVPIPPLLNLPRLLGASDRLLKNDESDEDLALLLAPGSSLGGARPKASIRDRDGRLMIAKFPRHDDEYNVVLWEAVALELARAANITVPDFRVETIAEKKVILIDRFDRVGGQRVPFLSAMSMIDAQDNEDHSYLELVDALTQYGTSAKNDKAQLWRRVVFNILISNTDDHLRNHAFLYEGQTGWRLSPAYDLNPVPADIKPRVLTTAIDIDNGTASLDLALSVIDDFGIEADEAHQIISEVGQSVCQWRTVAARYGLTNAEIERMSSAFEHEDLEQAMA